MYSKEHIKPKLHQLDQDKLARLYADLRRESLATGSFPITVRHLESMIRMSEASAKMHLREYVRSDDIDLAIQVTVGSFVNAQKMSIKKTLERVSPSFFLLLPIRLCFSLSALRSTVKGTIHCGKPEGRKRDEELRREEVYENTALTYPGIPKIRPPIYGQRRINFLLVGSNH